MTYLIIHFPGLTCYDTARDVQSANARVYMGYYGKVEQIAVYDKRPDFCDDLPFYGDLGVILKSTQFHVPGFHVCR